jgi:transposase
MRRANSLPHAKNASSAWAKHANGARTIPAPICPVPALRPAIPVLISGVMPVSTMSLRAVCNGIQGRHALACADMKAYSRDLREKILRAYDAHRGSQRGLAALFGVSRAFVENLLQRRRTTGTIAPRPHAGGRQPSCDRAAREMVARLLRAQPDATWEELCAQLGPRRGVWVSGPTMSRLLTRLGLPRQKNHFTPPSVTRRGSSRRVPGTGR